MILALPLPIRLARLFGASVIELQTLFDWANWSARLCVPHRREANIE
jgi:hypothetical protein